MPKAPELPLVATLDLDDTFLAVATVDGVERLVQIERRDVPGVSGDVLFFDDGDSPVILNEADHLGKFLQINNSVAAVTIQLPDVTGVVTKGLFCEIAVTSGAFPVLVQCLTPGQLRAPRHQGAAFNNNVVFLGPSTANADEIVARIYRRVDFWLVDCPFGVRQAQNDDNTLPLLSVATHAIEVRDEANTPITSDLTRLDFNGAVTVTNPSGGQVEVTITAGIPAETTLTFGATVAWDVTVNPTTQLALTGNCEIDASNIQNGATYKITLTQDATGGRVVTWDAGFVDKPEIELAPNAVTIIVFEAHAGGLYSPGNVGDPAKVGDLNELLVIDADADNVLIERDSDGAAFRATPMGIMSSIAPPIIYAVTSVVLDDTRHNRVLVLTASGTTITLTDLLTDGFATFVINRTGAAVTIAQSGLTLIGETTLSDNHFATLVKIATNIGIARVSG